MKEHSKLSVGEIEKLISQNKTKLITETRPTEQMAYQHEIKRLEGLLSGEFDFKSLDKITRQKIESDFYARLNREKQENEFEFFLEENPRFDKPFLFFVHGFHEDRHNGLVHRLNQKTEKFFKKINFSLFLEEWVNYLEKDKKLLFQVLRKKMLKSIENEFEQKRISAQLPSILESCEFLQDLLALKNSIVSFEINVYAKYWNSDILNVIEKDLFGKLFNFNLKDKEKPIFFFINLIYEPEATGIKAFFGNKNKKIETELLDFSKKNETQCFLLKKLTKIDYNHAHSFFSNEKFGILSSAEFIKPDEELPFDVFFNRCADKIAHFYINQNSVI